MDGLTSPFRFVNGFALQMLITLLIWSMLNATVNPSIDFRVPFKKSQQFESTTSGCSAVSSTGAIR